MILKKVRNKYAQQQTLHKHKNVKINLSIIVVHYKSSLSKPPES